MSRGACLTACVIGCWLIAAPPVDGAGKWTRLQSPNLSIEGDVSASDLADVARRLDQFREVLGRLLPRATPVTPTPVTVLTFARARDFRAIAPLYQGTPVEIRGFATVTLFGTGIALCLDGGDQAYQTIYHEFAHLLLSNALPHPPVWLEEGLAEFYSTFELSSDGRRARIGKPIPAEEFQYLREGRLLPMREVLTATRESAVYNVGADRNRFYAQCWATIHYLVLGNPARFAELTTFIRRLSEGMAEDEAFGASFAGGSAALEKETAEYVRRLTFSVGELRFDDRVEVARSYSSRAMSPAEVEASLGHMLLKQQRFDEAETRFRSALRLDATVGAAHTGLGLVRTLQGRAAEALPYLQTGAGLDAHDAMARYAYGFGILHCGKSDCGEYPELRAVAIREFARSVELAPPFPCALSYLALSEMTDPSTLADAERHGAEAVKLLPGREDYRLHLAQVYLRQQDFAKAQALLGPLAASSRQGLQADASRLLAAVPEIQKPEAAEARAPDSFAPNLPAVGREAAPSPPRPILRTIGGGEQRVEGTLEAMECGTDGLRVTLTGAGMGLKRLGATSLSAVEFISYRRDVSANPGCGAQQPMPVLLTWRPRRTGEVGLPAGVDTVVVAVEYISK